MDTITGFYGFFFLMHTLPITLMKNTFIPNIAVSLKCMTAFFFFPFHLKFLFLL